MQIFFFFKHSVYLFNYLFINFLPLAALGPRRRAQAPSSCGKQGLLTAVASPAAEHRLQAWDPSSCGTRAQQMWPAGSRAQVQQLWHMGPAAPRHVGSSRTRDRTRIPPHWQADSQPLHHQGSPEVQILYSKNYKTLLEKNLKDLCKCAWIGRLNVVKMAKLPNYTQFLSKSQLPSLQKLTSSN